MRSVMQRMKVFFVAVCVLAAALLPLSANAQTPVVPCDGVGPEDIVVITVVDDKGNTSDIRITCVSVSGATWTYRVEEVIIKHSLSHWILGIVTCLDHIQSFTPPGAEIGKDGSTGYTGIKWNTPSTFTSGLFTITLDKVYPASLMPIQAIAKAGKQYAVGNITGPDCSVTAIELASFGTTIEGNTVSIQWETAAEIDNAGFNLYRASGPDGSLVKINDQLIAAQGSGSSYSFSDTVGGGDHLYVLEDVDTSGVATRHLSATVAQAPFRDRMFLPMIGEIN